MPAVQMQASNTRKALINLRVSSSERDMIDRAASALGKNRTEFMLEAARRAAEEALLDQALFRLDAERLKAFRAALDAPANPPEALRQLMKRKAPWEV